MRDLKNFKQRLKVANVENTKLRGLKMVRRKKIVLKETAERERERQRMHVMFTASIFRTATKLLRGNSDMGPQLISIAR